VHKNEGLSRRLAEMEGELKHEKNRVENMNSDAKFMSDNLKRLGNEKLRLEKRINELERGKGHE
jgi:predicted nuclease with TOPRIM domain